MQKIWKKKKTHNTTHINQEDRESKSIHRNTEESSKKTENLPVCRRRRNRRNQENRRHRNQNPKRNFNPLCSEMTQTIERPKAKPS